MSLLQYAAAVGAADCMRALLEAGAETVELPGVWGWTALHAACWHGHPAALEVLLEHLSAATKSLWVNSATEGGYQQQREDQGYNGGCNNAPDWACTPLHLAMLGTISRKGWEGGDGATAAADLSRACTFIATAEQPAEDIRSSLAFMPVVMGWRPAVHSKFTAPFRRVVHTTMLCFQRTEAIPEELVLALLSMADVREYTIHGVGGGAECARLLLDAGAEVGLRTGRVSGACAMGAGSSTDEGECSEDDAGECSSNSDRPAHLTALHLAVIGGDVAAVKLLMERGATPQKLFSDLSEAKHIDVDNHDGRYAIAGTPTARSRTLFTLPARFLAHPLSLALSALAAIAGAGAGGRAIPGNRLKRQREEIVAALISKSTAAEIIESLTAPLVATAAPAPDAAQTGAIAPALAPAPAPAPAPDAARQVVRALYAEVHPDSRCSIFAADYAYLVAAPVATAFAKGLADAAPSVPTETVAVGDAFMLAVSAAIIATGKLPGDSELTKHLCSEICKAVNSKSDDRGNGTVPAAAFAEILPLCPALAPEQQRAVAAIFEYLIAEVLELGGNACRDDWNLAFRDQDWTGSANPLGVLGFVAPAAASKVQRELALPGNAEDDDDEHYTNLLFPDHIFTAMENDKELAILIPECETPSENFLVLSLGLFFTKRWQQQLKQMDLLSPKGICSAAIQMADSGLIPWGDGK